MDYFRPATLNEAFAPLAAGARVLAGGTDLYPLAQRRIAGPVVDLTGLPDLHGIHATPEGLRIGAMTTWSAIAEANLPAACRALQQAALQVGGRQIQNAGTIGGNLCNASPAADGVPPLLVLEAEVELASGIGTRRLALADFITGPRRTALAPGEVLVALHLPAAALSGRSAFLKLGARAYLVISIAMVAVRVQLAGDRISAARVAVGACSPVARRVPLAETALCGPVVGAGERLRAVDISADLAPIDDIRASAQYRRMAVPELVQRAFDEALA